MTTFDHIGVLVYLNGYFPEWSYWGYIYLKDGDIVNFDSIDRINGDACFDFTIDSDGNITPS